MRTSLIGHISTRTFKRHSLSINTSGSYFFILINQTIFRISTYTGTIINTPFTSRKQKKLYSMTLTYLPPVAQKPTYTHLIYKNQITMLSKLPDALDKIYGKGNYELELMTSPFIKLTTTIPQDPTCMLRSMGVMSQAIKIYA
jgi:hypothetical protein